MSAEEMAVLLGVALLTYATRAGGFFAMRFVRMTPRVRQWLGALPLSVMGAFLAPVALAGGIAELAGLAVTVVLTRAVSNGIAPILGGIGTVAALRAVL
jgi:uncharacterized membrane protein